MVERNKKKKEGEENGMKTRRRVHQSTTDTQQKKHYKEGCLYLGTKIKTEEGNRVEERTKNLGLGGGASDTG